MRRWIERVLSFGIGVCGVTFIIFILPLLAPVPPPPMVVSALAIYVPPPVAVKKHKHKPNAYITLLPPEDDNLYPTVKSWVEARHPRDQSVSRRIDLDNCAPMIQGFNTDAFKLRTDYYVSRSKWSKCAVLKSHNDVQVQI